MKFAMLGTFATEGFIVLVGILTGSLVARLLLPEGRGALQPSSSGLSSWLESDS